MQLTVVMDFLWLGEKEVNITITITAQTMGILREMRLLINCLEQTNLGLSFKKDKKKIKKKISFTFLLFEFVH